MKLVQTLKYGTILFICGVLASCSNDDNAPETAALNAIDLKILENCGDALQGSEGVNCCIVTPLEVTTDGFYAGGAKYMVNDGETVYEPEGLKYFWNSIGKGIEIDNATEQMVTFRFTNEFKGGIIETIILGQDGTERCVGRDTVYLKTKGS